MKQEIYAKLRGAIREKFGTQKAFAEAMGMHMSTLSLRLCGQRDWTRAEIEKAKTLLDIPAAELTLYFF